MARGWLGLATPRCRTPCRLQRSTVMATLVEGVQVAPLDATYIM